VPVLLVGIDDTATATQRSQGWAFIGLPQAGLFDLQTAVSSFARGASFHGSKCGPRNIGRYESFLVAIRDTVRRHHPSFLAHVFDDQSWHIDFGQFARTVVRQAGGNPTASAEAAVTHVLPPLMTLQRLLADQQLAAHQLEVSIDEHGFTHGFSSIRLHVRSGQIDAGDFTRIIYNAYRERLFPAASDMIPNGLHVVPDDQSILIQAADVFGNFAAAYAAYKLGATDHRQLKGEAFGGVFDDPDMSDILPALSLAGNHLEVTLSTPGSMRLLIN